MKKHLLLFLLALGFSFSFTACDEPGSFKPGYAGSFGELLVVMPNSLWEGELGDTVFEKLGAIQYGLPQDEPQFNVIQVSPKKFKSVLRSHRNVCIVSLDSNAVKPIVLQKSKWAKGQVVVTLSARTYQSLFEVVDEYADRAVEIFQQAELNRHYLRNKKFGSAELNQAVLDARGLSFMGQKDAYLEKNDKEVTWLRIERERPGGGNMHQISQGLLIWSQPYTDKLNFLDSVVYQTVDSVFQKHLLGPGENQFMQLNYRYIEPKGQEINFKDAFAKEYRGLWRMENNAMGGPMYLLVFLDEANQRVVYAFGYVFAPQWDKREYLREVEGMVRSLGVAV